MARGPQGPVVARFDPSVGCETGWSAVTRYFLLLKGQTGFDSRRGFGHVV